MRFMMVFLVVLAWSTPSHSRSVAIENVTIIDPGTGQRLHNMTVVWSGAKIHRVANGRLKLSPQTQRINGAGKYLIPGLWDMHVHLFNNATNAGTNDVSSSYPLLIGFGVTGVRDMWTDAEDRKAVEAWRREIQRGRMFGPRVVVGSRILDGSPPAWSNSVAIDNATAAAAIVREEKELGAQFIKVYERLSRPSFLAIARQAQRLGLPFAGHVPFSVTALEASRAGQASIEHLTDMLETCSGSETQVRTLSEGRARAMLSASAFDAGKCRSAGLTFARQQTAHTPTLVMHQGRLVRPFGKTADPRAISISNSEQRSWAAADARMSKRDPAVLRELFTTYLRISAELTRGGALILAGTDLGNPHVFAGSSLHDELALMVQAGMSPQAALASATTNPARYLHREGQFGSVGAGKVADLVLLEADPLDNIENTRRIAAVISNGVYLDASKLRQLKEEAAHVPQKQQSAAQ